MRPISPVRISVVHCAVMTLVGSALFVASASTSRAATNIGTDRQKVSQIEQQINSQGARVQSLVSAYNTAEGRLLAIKKQISNDQSQLIQDRKVESTASVHLRQWAVDAYVNAAAGNSPALGSLSNSGSAISLPAQQVYLGFANGNLQTAMTNLSVAESRTATTQVALHAEQNKTVATLRQLNSAQSAATAALGADEALLRKVNKNILSIVVAANARRAEARERAAEQAIAIASAEHESAAQNTASSPAPPSAPGTYTNPLRGIGGLRPERIDQGVDFSGFGPIFAIGNGVVISTVVGGWPGGTFISYRLTSGPANGRVVYAAEDIDPEVQPGQTVSASTVLGRVYEGSYGIETGWADSSGDGSTMAADYGQYDGGNSTAFGYNFSQLLRSLGTSGGILQNSPPTGSLPAGWPHW